jgi:hypothetical protein
MSPTRSFSAGEPLLRLAELARVALATKRQNERGDTNRQFVPDDVRSLLRSKCDNPILGIYAAHLLLMESTVDVPLLRDVVGHLRVLLRAPHPDVEALALRADLGTPIQPFTDPPMLSPSWSLIVEATIAHPELVSDGLTRRTTGEFPPEGPWHVWKSAATREEANGGSAVSDLDAALLEDLGVLKHVRQLEHEPSARGSPSGSVESVAFAARPSVLPVEVDEERLRALARRFSLPPSQLRRVLDGLEERTAHTRELPAVKLSFKP